VVADAAVAATHEQHADRRHVRHLHRVVPGAARQPERRDALRGDARRERRLQALVARRRLELEERHPFERDVAARGDRAAFTLDRRHRGEALGVAARAHVDRERDLAGDHVDRAPAGDRELADGADQHALRRRRVRLDVERHLRRRRQRVAARAHRHRAGVPGEPGDARGDARRARDRRHDAEREPAVEQHGTLLDVDLDEGGDVAVRA
jgi:hypothetical protein